MDSSPSSDPVDPDYKALLIEALARSEAMERMVGDFASPFYAKDVYDLGMAIQHMRYMHAEEPQWVELEDDPFYVLWDEETINDMEAAVEARTSELLARSRADIVAYHERKGDKDWRPWWRTTPMNFPT